MSSLKATGFLGLGLLAFVLSGCNMNAGSSVIAGPTPSPNPTPTPVPTPTPTPTPSPTATIHITVDALENRHAISALVYGVNFPPNTAYIGNSGATLVRWGGNASTRYNWKNFDTNAAQDFFFANRTFANGADSTLYTDSTKFVTNIVAAGGNAVMTIGMLPWVAKDSSSGSFSVKKYGAQCQVNPFNSDEGNGILKSDCKTPITGNDPNDAHVPLLDFPGASDPPGSVYRSQWVAALAPNFGSSPHFYDMDNEIDIWASTHRDVHPTPTGYNELRDVYLAEARAIKSWDPQAMRFGPVSCCWWFYWNAAANSDKSSHGGIDFLPWWLNEIAWSDAVAGARSLEVLDLHAYPDAPDMSTFSLAQKQALALRIFRDWWDPTYTSESGSINQPFVTQMQPAKTIPFRIPRLRAMANSIYPGTLLSITEWNAAFAGETDFSTALVDADAWGILGRERVWASSRWTAANPSSPAFLALKLFRNYDSQHHAFASVSVAAFHDGDPNTFSSYAAVDPAGTQMTVLTINKNPSASVQAQINLNGFTPSQVTTFALAQTSPNSIVSSPAQSWTPNWTFAPFSATLLVVNGSMAQSPSAEWDLNPDVTMVPAGGTVVLQPKLISGAGSVTLGSIQSDSGVTIANTQANLTASQTGALTVTAATTPGFYHFTVSATDNLGVKQNQGGWILVANPAASLTKSGDGQSGAVNTTLTLSVTLNPGQSGATLAGASILFTTDGGTVSNRIVATDSSGTASVTLTLPANPGTIHIRAEGPFSLGHPVVMFTETAH